MLYAPREAVPPDPGDRARIGTTFASLQAVRPRMDPEQAPGGFGPQQAEAVRSQQRIIRRRIIRRRIIRQAPERDDAIAVRGWCNGPVDCSDRERYNAAAPRGSRHNQAGMGSGTPSIETARPPATTGGLGGERQPHGRGLVICTVQAQDQAPGGVHLQVSQASETTGY